MVEGLKQGAAVGQRAKAIETHGIQPLEDIAIFPMLGSTAMLFDETPDLLEAGDDPLLAGCPA